VSNPDSIDGGGEMAYVAVFVRRGKPRGLCHQYPLKFCFRSA
jgi:hypothetical protein